MQVSGDGLSVKGLNPNVIAGLFRDAQERRAPEDVIKLADSLKKAKVPIDRFQRVRALCALAAHRALSLHIQDRVTSKASARRASGRLTRIRGGV